MTRISSKNLKKTGGYPEKAKFLRNFGFVSRLPVILLLVALSIGAAGGFLYYRWANTPVFLSTSPIQVSIPTGASLRTAIAELQASGVRIASWPTTLLVKYRGVETKIKAGYYEIHAGVTPIALLDKLVRGDVMRVDAVIPEGWTFSQIRSRLDAHSGLRHDTVRMSDTEIMKALGAPEKHPEGLFFPDTYHADKGSSDLKLLAKAYKAMQQQLAEAWAARSPSLPLKDPYQALILASIIEKETGLPSDRPYVASVFINRLSRGMRLQTDPTVIYGIGASFDGNLRKRDLRKDTPYNTYSRAGLPPTPIAMPGRASLLAAVRPATSDALYFVARGDGSSEFSKTLSAHNRAVNRYQRGR